MKIRSNVKAGIWDQQHNEKLSADADSIEKKSFGKKLRLNKETIRQLKDIHLLKGYELMRVAGGAAISGRPACRSECLCDYTY